MASNPDSAHHRRTGPQKRFRAEALTCVRGCTGGWPEQRDAA